MPILILLQLKKYAKLVKFNTQIVFLSLSMDVLIIAMMSLNNDFVYMQFVRDTSESLLASDSDFIHSILLRIWSRSVADSE